MRCLTIALPLALAACLPTGPDPLYPNRDVVIAVASSCGVENFKPTKVGAGIAAYVPKSVENYQQKEDCIYDKLHAKGYIVTR